MPIYIPQVKDLQSKLDEKLTGYIDTKTLVIPIITPSFTFTLYDGTTNYPFTLSKNITVDVGAICSLTATYLYPNAGTTEHLPTSATGSWNTELPVVDTNSSTITVNDITTDYELIVNLFRNKTGLMVVNDKLTLPIGTDTSKDVYNIYFRHKYYFGTSSSTSLDSNGIKNLSIKAFCQNKEINFTGITALDGEYLYYCYPVSFGTLSGAVLNIAEAILGAFTNISTTSIVNDGGFSVNYYVYRSNADGAFLNDSISFM